MSNEYIHFNNNAQPAINEDNLNLMQQLIKQDITGAVSGDTLPIGAFMPYPGTTAPTNWLICDGSAISRTTYQDLFNLIGTTFGTGDGSTTFNLPDMRLRTPVGVDTRDSNLNAVGKTYGEKNHTMTVNELVEHYHPQSLAGGSGGNVGKAAYSWSVPENQYDYTGVDLAARTGGSQPFNVMQPSMATNFIIKAFQTAGVVAQVTSTHTSSSTDVYSCNYINKIADYSTTEKQIGQWIDNKPLYRKVINFGSLPNATTKKVDHNISNLRDIVSISGIAKDPNGNIYMPIPLSYSGGSVQYNTDVFVNATQIGINATEDRSRYTAYIVLEYTKTTD